MLDGTDLTSLREMRFYGRDKTDYRSASMEQRRLYLTRYMQEASEQKRSRRAQRSARPPLEPHTTVLTAATDSTKMSATSHSPALQPISPYPPSSTYAVAEALLAESSTSTAVPLSSLPTVILSHCSPPALFSLSANSSALQRLRSMCDELSTALLSRAFADLHSRGCVVTAGLLYGGDLLLYADDPANCHAHSIVSVHSACQSSTGDPVINALDLLTVARIASGVSKGVVLAYEAAGADEMTYVSLQWQPSISAVP